MWARTTGDIMLIKKVRKKVAKKSGRNANGLRSNQQVVINTFIQNFAQIGTCSIYTRIIF